MKISSKFTIFSPHIRDIALYDCGNRALQLRRHSYSIRGKAMNSRSTSILAASTLLAGVLALSANAIGGKAAAPAARPAPAPAPAPAPKAPANTPNNSTNSNPNNHYQRNPPPYDYGYGYGYGYGDGGSGSTTGTTTNTPNNNKNQANPAPSNTPSASSDSGGSGRNSPATQPTAAPIDPEVAAATAELNTAMTNLRATLSAQPDYAAALTEKQHASEEAAAFHEAGSTGGGDISEIAARGLTASKTLSQIERTAMANDPAVQAAKAHLKAALAGQGSSAKSS